MAIDEYAALPFEMRPTKIIDKPSQLWQLCKNEDDAEV